MTETPAPDQLRSFVERILRLKEEQKTIGDDIKDVYAEAKSSGFDKTVLGMLVTEIIKRDKDASKQDEITAILELYRDAWHASCTHAHARAA